MVQESCYQEMLKDVSNQRNAALLEKSFKDTGVGAV